MSDTPKTPNTGRGKWLHRVVIVLGVLATAYVGLDLYIKTDRVQRAFASRMTAAFGRPVDVSNFTISILEGPRLVANYVTVSEDPRFGNEHFLRAERLTAGVRWRALLRGRLEFDTVSFTRPSLNLVRNADGSWNLESWLPRPAAGAGSAPAAPAGASTVRQTHFTRINIDTGRINFKRGVDKHPFAFTNVNGFVERDADGHWHVDLESSVTRAAVTLQDPGTLRLFGSIGSTASRLQPASLQLTWQEASISDALRLARGWDYGVRGDFELNLVASAPPPSPVPATWLFKADLRLRDVHRWNFPQQPTDPDLNLVVDANWTPQRARIEFAKILLDAPNSGIRARGFLQWAKPEDSRFSVLSTGVRLNDLLDWYRAFRTGVAPGLSIEGNAGLDAELGGWPIKIRQATLASDRAEIRVPALDVPVRVGPAVVQWTPAKIGIRPIQFTLAPAAAPGARPERARKFQLSFTGENMRPRAGPAPRNAAWLAGNFKLNLGGQMDRFQDFLAITRAFGWTLDGGWAVDGPAIFGVEWDGRFSPFAVDSQGSVHFVGTRLLPPFLNQPIVFTDALFAWTPPPGGAARPAFTALAKPGERRLTLYHADVFGSSWTGTISSLSRGPWEFTLATDRIEVAAVNQWLNPARQQGLFQRLINSAATRRGTAAYEEQLGRFHARGRVAVEQFIFTPVTFRKLRGALELDGRKLSLTDAQADFFGGTASGSVRAELAAEPSYEVQAKFDRVNLATLTAATQTMKSLFAGTASGELSLTTHGIGRENLLAALEGQGTFEIRDAQYRALDLLDSATAGVARPGLSSFRNVTARLSVAAQKFQFEEFRLAGSPAQWEAEGTVDFARQLDLRLLYIATPPDAAFQLTGPVSSPRLVRVPSLKKP